MQAPSTTASLSLPDAIARTAKTPHDTSQLLALLYRHLRALAGPRPDLDDIVQSAAERALKSIQGFEGRSQLSTWAYGVAYRTLLDHDRWYARLRRRLSYAEDLNLPEPRSPIDAEALVLEARRAKSLYRALDQLPTSKRAVVVLHDIQGLSASEVAEVVGTNERTVRSRLRDARNKLTSLLEQDPVFCRKGHT
jgi:RNA polymerase sigma-70 factor (ECF subfamily)